MHIYIYTSNFSGLTDGPATCGAPFFSLNTHLINHIIIQMENLSALFSLPWKREGGSWWLQQQRKLAQDIRQAGG